LIFLKQALFTNQNLNDGLRKKRMQRDKTKLEGLDLTVKTRVTSSYYKYRVGFVDLKVSTFI
jgi:hypothetical protein